MTEDERLIIETARAIEAGRPCVLCTVVGARGRTPRNAGARMLWFPDGDAMGTIGGGRLEHLCIDRARRVLEARQGTMETFNLGADADQCCGGVVDVLFEPLGSARRLVIFGAGHVARELASLLRTSPFALTIVDERPDWNDEARFPNCRRVHDVGEGTSLVEGDACALVMTHSHDLDHDILVEILPRGTPYVGLIGSRSKRACFETRLETSGVHPDRIQAMRCPIGLGDMGKEPRAVAISIAGELLLEARRV
ncbi:MAG: xanthine dehydrogenase accessory protein XdhC [Phycisphaerales bacterium]|nr:xanthine dehydrogenase accessory protein XdhC [Phycisphaerales bacterium]